MLASLSPSLPLSFSPPLATSILSVSSDVFVPCKMVMLLDSDTAERQCREEKSLRHYYHEAVREICWSSMVLQDTRYKKLYLTSVT